MASSAAPMPRHFNCRQCQSLILFPGNLKKRTCTCGATVLLEEFLELEEEDAPEGEAKAPEDEEVVQSPGSVEEPDDAQASKVLTGTVGGRRRQPRKGQDEVDYLEMLALLMQLAFAVCNADLLDCVAVVRNFAVSELSALSSIANKVCHELAVLNGDDGGFEYQKGSMCSSPSMAKPCRKAEQLVSTFLADRLPINKLGTSWGRSRRSSTSSAEWLASDALRPSDGVDPTSSVGSRRLKRSATSNTEISITSYSEFARDNKTFCFKPEADPSASSSKAAAGRSRRASCSSSKPGLSKRGSVGSLGSAHTGMSRMTQVSTLMRSLLRSQADKSKTENIGDLAWGMDGVPQDKSDQYVQQTKALIQRYGGERRPPRAQRTSSSTTVDQPVDVQPTKGSLMMFILRGAQTGTGTEQDMRSYRGSMEDLQSTAKESVTTSVLLDHALAGMDLGGAHPRHKQGQSSETDRPRTFSKDSFQSSGILSSGLPGFKRLVSGESASSLKMLEHEINGVADGHRRQKRAGTQSGVFSNVNNLRLIEEASAASSSKPSGDRKEEKEELEAEGQPLTAKEKWLKRKEQKKKRRAAGGRTTYGEIIRNGYEQFLSGNAADKSDAPTSEKGAEPKHASSSGLQMLNSAVESARAGALFEGEPLTPGGTIVEGKPSKDDARARWEQRRAQKRAARQASSKTTYGQLVRLEHEQMLKTDAAGAAATPRGSGGAHKKLVLSSVRFKTHDGSLGSTPSSSTSCEDVSRERSRQKAGFASALERTTSSTTSSSAQAHHELFGAGLAPGRDDLCGVLYLSGGRPRRSDIEVGTTSEGCGSRSILKDSSGAQEGRQQRRPARSVEFNLKQNLVYDLQDPLD